MLRYSDIYARSWKSSQFYLTLYHAYRAVILFCPGVCCSGIQHCHRHSWPILLLPGVIILFISKLGMKGTFDVFCYFESSSFFSWSYSSLGYYSYWFFSLWESYFSSSFNSGSLTRDSKIMPLKLAWWFLQINIKHTLKLRSNLYNTVGIVDRGTRRTGTKIYHSDLSLSYSFVI